VDKILPTFLVDTKYDDRELRRAVRGLRAVQKMGKLAERALAEISRKGHYDGRAPWLAPPVYGKKYHIKYSRFPASPTLSRESVPEYGPVRVVPGYTTWKQKYGGFEYDCFDVRVRIAVPVPDGTFSLSDVKVGFVKLNVGSPAFNAVHFDEKERSRSVPLLRDPRRIHVVNTAKVIAEAAAGRGFRTDPFPAVYYGRLSEWLIEDGHVLSFLADIRQRAANHKLARQIITT
jgi:hypothetical protein